MNGRALLVANPSAQSGKAAAHIERAERGLVERGAEVVFVATEPEGRTVEVTRNAIEEHAVALVVYLGGDGTFNEVARGILASDRAIPLGMLPMGTANNQGRSLGVRPGPAAIDANLDIIARGHTVALDVGAIFRIDEDGARAEHTHFFDSVGWGMQPEILNQRNRDRAAVQQIPWLREIYRDQAVYAGATLERYLASFIEPTKFDATIVSGGEEHHYAGLTDLIISGTPIYAGEWVVDRFAEPDDGKFELMPMQGRRDWASKALRDLRVLPLFQEDLDVIGITHASGYSASDFEVSFSRPDRAQIATQVDGEQWHPGVRFVVDVLPNALAVIAPSDFVPPWRFGRDG